MSDLIALIAWFYGLSLAGATAGMVVASKRPGIATHMLRKAARMAWQARLGMLARATPFVTRVVMVVLAGATTLALGHATIDPAFAKTHQERVA